MIRWVLLGLVGIAIFAIAPIVGATNTVSVDTKQTLSNLLARTIFDFAEEVEGKDGEELRESRSERREEGDFDERREDAERFFDE